MKVKVKLDECAKMPTKAHKADAGFDLYLPTNINKLTVPANVSAIVDTGVHMAIPEGYVGMIKSKSGLNIKHNLQVEGVVDSGFEGSIVVKIYNHSNTAYEFKGGEKLTQIVLLPIPDVELEETDHLEETERGSNGFGSSGK